MKSQLYTADIIKEIREKARIGRYPIRGYGSTRSLPHFDDLVFLPAQLTRLAIDTYRESVVSRTVLGTRFAEKPLVLDSPMLVAAMSYGAVNREVKLAFAKASARAGIADNTGEGGMLPEEHEAAHQLIYQCTPGRYGFSLSNLLRADAVELYIGQGAKAGAGGQLMAEKVTEEIASVRGIPKGVDLRSPVRHPDIFGGDDLMFKVQELREATNHRVPIIIKMGAGRVREDVKLACKCGADIIALDGMQGGTGASPELLLDHVGVPTLAALVMAVEALEELDLKGKVHLVIQGGIRNGADAAKALALGADAVAFGTALLLAVGCTACQKCHSNTCEAGLCTQDPLLRAKNDVDMMAEQAYRFLKATALEIEMVAKVCGKTNVHNLEPEDLRALTPEAARIAKVPFISD